MDSKNEIAKLFLQFDYAEMKSLAVSFITFQTAVLASSIVFADKIVRVDDASKGAKDCIHVSWYIQVIAVALVYVSLGFNLSAGDRAIYQESFQPQFNRSLLFLVLSGLFFLIGLFVLVLAAAPSRPRPRAGFKS